MRKRNSNRKSPGTSTRIRAKTKIHYVSKTPMAINRKTACGKELAAHTPITETKSCITCKQCKSMGDGFRFIPGYHYELI